MTDQKFRKGQRVKALGIVTEVYADGDCDIAFRYRASDGHETEVEATVHRNDIEALPDDPATDPVGTVREMSDFSFVRLDYRRDGNLYPWVLVADDPKRDGYCGANGHEFMRGSTVIGAVPGTPAFEVYGHLNGGAE